MNKNKPMTLLLIDDDITECKRYEEFANTRNDINFVGITASSDEGLHYVQTYFPDGIILELLLNEGQGTGLEFLDKLKSLNLPFKPLIIVTTWIFSDLTKAHVLMNGADFIYYKGQPGYNPALVINTFVGFRNTFHSIRNSNKPTSTNLIESPEERKKRISAKICFELDLIGFRKRYKGYQYLHDAIYLHVCNDICNATSIIEQVAKSVGRDYSSVFRVMHTAIKNAWKYADPEELFENYRYYIPSDTRIPTTSDFIYNFADKIRKSI